MRLDGGACHLTYCTNIHPGETWPEIHAALERHLPIVKRRLAPDRPFGVGLRLSGVAADALADEGTFSELKAFLDANDLYVFTINGFPYGPFHGTRVKEEVYRPDWREEERLRYSNRLADLLARLLPDDPEVEGSVSTVPGAFKALSGSAEAVAQITRHLLRHVAHLIALRRRTGRTICLALEPEPCCFLETVEETASFFEQQLFAPSAVTELATLADIEPAEADAALHRHIGVCLDLCHAAVEYEDPALCVARLRNAGIRIAKLQVTAGLRLENVDAERAALLRPFDDNVYLHQVVERSGGRLNRYVDLADAFESLNGPAAGREWRVHCHVPVFLDDLGALSTTQSFIREVLALQRAEPLSRHLEVETYTWGVLPERYRGEDIDTAIARELEWTAQQLVA